MRERKEETVEVKTYPEFTVLLICNLASEWVKLDGRGVIHTASNALVASSRHSKDGFRSSALAIAKRCLYQNHTSATVRARTEPPVLPLASTQTRPSDWKKKKSPAGSTITANDTA